MKRIWAVLLCAAMLLALVGCGGAAAPETTAATEAVQTPEMTKEEFARLVNEWVDHPDYGESGVMHFRMEMKTFRPDGDTNAATQEGWQSDSWLYSVLTDEEGTSLLVMKDGVAGEGPDADSLSKYCFLNEDFGYADIWEQSIVSSGHMDPAWLENIQPVEGGWSAEFYPTGLDGDYTLVIDAQGRITATTSLEREDGAPAMEAAIQLSYNAAAPEQLDSAYRTLTAEDTYQITVYGVSGGAVCSSCQVEVPLGMHALIVLPEGYAQDGRLYKDITCTELTENNADGDLICYAAYPLEARFQYAHSPLDNPAAMEDIVENPDAVYGFSPNPSSKRLGTYASYDWTDPAVVEKGRQDRMAYHSELDRLYELLHQMRSEGKSIEEMARSVSAERNKIRLASYKDDPEGLEKVKASNLATYGNEEGPTADSLFEKYGSWETVIQKAFGTNSGMDACVGLYDDYYTLYIELGLISE